MRSHYPGTYIKTTRSGPPRTYLQLVGADLDSLIDGLLKVTGRPGLAATGATVNADTTVFKRALELGDVWAVMQL